MFEDLYKIYEKHNDEVTLVVFSDKVTFFINLLLPYYILTNLFIALRVY
jgi:hypothetical protein